MSSWRPRPVDVDVPKKELMVHENDLIQLALQMRNIKLQATVSKAVQV
jgi:hypothetical protein